MTRACVCKTCGIKFAARSATGRKPVYCGDHGRKTAGSKQRDTARKKSKRGAVVRKITAADMDNAGRLAVGLSQHGSLDAAAQWAGIDAELMPVDVLEGLAKKHYSDVISGDLGGLGRRIVSLMNMIVLTTAQAIDECAPRDRINGLRQLASARDLLIGKEQSSEYAQINLTVIGAGGEAIKITSNE